MNQYTFTIVLDEVDEKVDDPTDKVNISVTNLTVKDKTECDGCRYGYWIPEFGQTPSSKMLKKFSVYYYDKIFNDLHNNKITQECFEFYSKDCSQCFKHIKFRKGIIVPIEPINGHLLHCKVPNGCFACKQTPYSPFSKKYNTRPERCFACITFPYVYRFSETEYYFSEPYGKKYQEIGEDDVMLDFYAYMTDGCESCKTLFEQRNGKLVDTMPYPENFD